jgi:autotransporter adhesin
MAPFRMPFTNRKGPIPNGLETTNDENVRPGANGVAVGKDSVALGSKSARDQPNEYKMSRQ